MKKLCPQCSNDELIKANINLRGDLSENTTRFTCTECKHTWYETDDTKQTTLFVGPHWSKRLS